MSKCGIGLSTSMSDVSIETIEPQLRGDGGRCAVRKVQERPLEWHFWTGYRLDKEGWCILLAQCVARRLFQAACEVARGSIAKLHHNHRQPKVWVLLKQTSHESLVPDDILLLVVICQACEEARLAVAQPLRSELRASIGLDSIRVSKKHLWQGPARELAGAQVARFCFAV
eukprot:5732603-Pleurochrysis_carterae.AAC.2